MTAIDDKYASLPSAGVILGAPTMSNEWLPMGLAVTGVIKTSPSTGI